MSFRAHGKWCGPGWSAGQWKDAKDLTEEDKKVEAIDELDQACKEHDIGIAEGDPEANDKFVEKVSQLGFKGAAFGALVKWLGPSTQSILQNKKKMTRRNVKDEDYEAWKSSNSIRLKNKQKEKRQTEREFRQDENRIYNPREDISTNEEPKQIKTKMWTENIDLKDDPDRREAIKKAATRIQQTFRKQIDAERNRQKDMIYEQNRNRNNPLQSIQDAIDRMNEVTTDLEGNVINNETPEETKENEPNLTANKPNRPASSLSNLSARRQIKFNSDSDTSMDPEPEPMAMAMSSSNTDGNPSTHRQVQPNYKIPREIGFITETRSVMLPLTIYFSVNKLDANQPVVFKFMLNDTYDIFRYTTVQEQTYPATSTNYTAYTNTNPVVPGDQVHNVSRYAGVDRSKGISNDMACAVCATFNHGVKINKSVGQNMLRAYQFPSTTYTNVSGNTTKTGSDKFGYGDRAAQGDYAPAWRDFYENIYRNRHVMQTDWRLTIQSAQSGAYHRGVVLSQTETITTQSVATPILPTTKPLAQMLRFKRIKEHALSSFDAQGGKVVDVISGSWTPNSSIRRDVVDDEKCKVWYPTKGPNSPSPFDWKEFQTLLFYNDEMSNMQNSYYNCKLELLYHVQYRDLIETCRFPTYADTTSILTVQNMTYPQITFTAGNFWPSADEPGHQEAINLAHSLNNAAVKY